ncbi:MAG: AAA family ATPase [Spirochaetes bacterium]|nr:AAA family ATPase [Spirochaetota bacterium]
MDSEELDRIIRTISSFRDRYRLYVGSRVVGYPELLDRLFIAFLAGGSVLLEGAPGLGKTTLARAYSTFFGLDYSRVQFTPDLMPLDIVGSNILEDEGGGRRSFRFYRGPIFSNIILGDEINRASPKTQSAFLEAMEEKRVTFLGTTYELPKPFFVIATQNPIELEGTYPLPEAQIDRFIMKLDFAMPDFLALREIMNLSPGDMKGAPADREETLRVLADWENASGSMASLSEVTDYAARLVLSTHPDKSESRLVRTYVAYGASPRCAVALLRAAKAAAAADGRPAVSYDDLDDLFLPVTAHRIVMRFEAEADGIKASDIVADARAVARHALTRNTL